MDEKVLRGKLMQTDNRGDFCRALVRFMKSMKEEVVIEFEKVFEEKHRPKYKAQLIRTIVDFQRTEVMRPEREISINSDCTKFRILILKY